jgi:ferredoxin
MVIRSVKPIYFSPTRTTARIVEGIAQGTQLVTSGALDLTPPDACTRPIETLGSELVILGAPVYGGRIPAESVQRFRRLKANGAPAVVVVVYGNRAYEDALLELRDLAVELGFRPVAAGAFIGEHSYSTEAMPTAHGRPDTADLARAHAFGAQLRSRLEEQPSLLRAAPVHVPGAFPYKDWSPPVGIAPITNDAACTRCGTCAQVCPTAAITIGDAVTTDPALCIRCSACVKQCPTGGRVWEHPRILQSREWLSTSCRERKEPVLFWSSLTQSMLQAGL